jgi:hypothetical protein
MAGLGYSGQGRRSDGSGRTVGAPVTAVSARKARSNTGCAAAVAVAVVVVVAAAAAVAAAAVAVLRNVSMPVRKQVSMQDDAGQVRACQGRRDCNTRSQTAGAYRWSTGRHCRLRADIPRTC